MRKQDKALLWPAYFDSSRTRKMGRRVSKKMAVKSPKMNELINAVSKLGFHCELIPEVSYPKKPWIKTGLLLIEKKYPKEQLINKIAKQLVESRDNFSRKGNK
jgi:signal recognition particle subunit SRP19